MKKYYHTFLIPLLITNLIGETITVSGRVVDRDNIPIQNVNIYTEIKGATSNNNGYFVLIVDNTELLNFSHIGFKNISYIATDVPIEIVMDQLIATFDQILVKGGFQTHRLSDSDNSITVITNNEFRNGQDDHFQDLISQIPKSSEIIFSSGVISILLNPKDSNINNRYLSIFIIRNIIKINNIHKQ